MRRTKPILIAAAAAAPTRRQHSRQKVENILTERELLLAELTALSGRGAASRFLDNAKDLLTRSWSANSWTAREKLLRSASWLIQLEQRRGQPIRLS